MGPSVDDIRKWLTDEDVNLRRASVEAAGRIGWQAVELVPDLVAALKDEDTFVMRIAVTSLGKVNPPPAEAVEPLIEIIADESDDRVTKKLAAWALGRMGAVAAAALPALEALGQAPDSEGWGEDENEQLRVNAVRAMGSIRAGIERMRARAPYVVESEKKVTVIREVDVAVIGSGAAGLIAAAAAERAGARTLLIEKFATVFPAIVYSGTAGIFNCFRANTEAEANLSLPGEHSMKVSERERATIDAVRSGGSVDQVLGGVAWDFIKHLVELGGFTYKDEREALMCRRLQVDPEVAQYGAITFMEQNGVEVLVQSPGCGPIMDGNRVAGVFVENKSGRRAVLAKAVVDASGESDIAAQAGAPTALGRDIGAQSGSLLWVIENFPQEPDLPFRSGQDSANGPDPELVHALAKEQGFAIKRDLDGRSWCVYRMSGHGAFAGQYLDGGDGEDVTIAEITNRKYAFEFIRFCRERVPGFENVRLRQISPQILWRGVRCIIGDAFMTKDRVDARPPNDRAIYLHRAVRYGPGEYLQVPYDVLLPQNVEGILVAGKCASGARREAAWPWARRPARRRPSPRATASRRGSSTSVSCRPNCGGREFRSTSRSASM